VKTRWRSLVWPWYATCAPPTTSEESSVTVYRHSSLRSASTTQTEQRPDELQPHTLGLSGLYDFLPCSDGFKHKVMSSGRPFIIWRAQKQPCQRKQSQLHVTEADKLLMLVIACCQWQQISLTSIYFVHMCSALLCHSTANVTQCDFSSIQCDVILACQSLCACGSLDKK